MAKMILMMSLAVVSRCSDPSPTDGALLTWQ